MPADLRQRAFPQVNARVDSRCRGGRFAHGRPPRNRFARGTAQGTGVDGIPVASARSHRRASSRACDSGWCPASQAVVDGGTARALSRQQQDVDIRVDDLAGPNGSAGRCCVLPWCRAAAQPHRRRAAGSVGLVGLPLASGLALALAFPTHDLWWLAPVGVALLSAAVLGACWRLAGLLGLAAGLGLLRADPVVVRRLRRRPALDRAVHPGGPLHRRHVRPSTAAVQRPLLATRACARSRIRRAAGLGPAGGARGHDAVRRLPVGPAGVQPGRQPARPPSPRSPAPRASPSRWRRWGCCCTPAASVLAPAARAAPRRTPGRGRSRPPRSVARCWPSPRLLGAGRRRCHPAHGRPAGVGAVRPGQRARSPGWTSTPSGAGARQPRRRPPCAARDAAGRPAPSLVVWPENASDIDPLRNPDADAAIRSPSTRSGADPRRGGARRARAATSPTSACSTGPGGGEPAALRQAAPGAVRRVHPVPVLLPRTSATRSTWSAPTSPRATGRRLPGARTRRARPTGPSRRSASRWPTTT